MRAYAVLGLLLTGDLRGAKLHVESLRELAEKLRDRYWLGTTFYVCAQVSIYEGDWETARHFPIKAWQFLPWAAGAWQLACS